ncbi:MAG: Cytochrome heme domain, partial [Gaiellaceae bacterium]|nr:Cytochrome heme domain [Gaiellaceae bacterium]
MDRRQFLAGAAAFPLALRFGSQALAGGRAVALVTADTQARVAVVDLSTGKILRSIATAAGPRSIESVNGNAAVVCHTAHGVVTLIEASLQTRRVLGAFKEPRYTAAAANGHHAFVTDSGRHEVVTVDVLHGRVVARVATGGPARHVSLAPDNKSLWVSLGSKAEEVAVLDVSQPLRPRLVRR